MTKSREIADLGDSFVNGNLTSVGTIDGRDVAVDGAKLDGIEAGATADQTITLSGDLTGSGTTSINAQLVADVVGATELNVTGNGTTAQYLRSDADGSFTWATPPDTNTTYSAGTGITLTGTVFSVTGGTGITADAGGVSLTTGGVTATQLNVTGNGTTSQYLRSDADGSFTWATPPDTTYAVGNGGLTEINFTSADNTKLDGIAAGAQVNVAPTAAQIGTATAALAAGAVGTYAMAGRYLAVTHSFIAGSTYAGSGLKYGGAAVTGDTTNDGAQSAGYPQCGSTVLSGTWRAMGEASRTSQGTTVTMFLRIS